MIVRLQVSIDVYEFLTLPPGYREVSKRQNEALHRCYELSIEGEFPAHVPAGAEVGMIIHSYADHLEWHWRYDGADIGAPIKMARPQPQ